MEELAARQRGILANGAVLFARNADGEEKTAARQRVLDLFRPERWPQRLHMLTMPSLQWRFERKLLGSREVGWLRASAPRRTYFTSLENERAIYFAAVAQMPGLHTPNSELRRIRPERFRFAEMAVKTRYASFFFANVDDMMMQDYWDEGWDAVWLDYCGPMTVERLALIARFYRDYVRAVLVITVLNGRHPEKTVEALAKFGDHSRWFRAHLDGEVLHDFEYFDTSPMVQFAIRKCWKSPLV